MMVDLEEWIWDCYPIQIRHGGLKPTIRMMYTDVYRGSITNNTKGLVEHGCTSSRGMGGTHFHTQLEAVKTFELCRHRSAQHQLGLLEDEVSKLFASYGNHMETIWKPYGNHMETYPYLSIEKSLNCPRPLRSGWPRCRPSPSAGRWGLPTISCRRSGCPPK